MKIGQVVQLDYKFLEGALEENSALSFEQLSIKLSSNHTTVQRHHHQLERFLNSFEDSTTLTTFTVIFK